MRGGEYNNIVLRGEQVNFIVKQQNFSKPPLFPPPPPCTFNYDFCLIVSFPVSSESQHHPPMFIFTPGRLKLTSVGLNVSFEWNYTSGDLNLVEVVFGIFDNWNFLETKLIAVNSSGFVLKRPSNKPSVGCAGNLTYSNAVFELYNVKLEDGKKYGILLEYGSQHNLLINTVKLQVKSGRK